jgi:transcriptional regulator with GAF, ATPase, and Fis domain
MHGVDPTKSAGAAAADAFAGLVGRSPAIVRLRRELRAVAASEATVLLTGETGTGKGLVARSIHAASRRAAGPLVHVDCAALAPSVIESELFGHERGAFTGAESARAGRLELAAHGTLFLDEVGELEPRLQAKLLRALQERVFERVGGARTLAMTARVVAATNRDLRRAVATGGFRADLYFRLQVVELELPPLRARLEDLPLLVEHGLRELALRHVRVTPEPTPAFLEALARQAWPGNVRELLNLLERLLVQRPGPRLGPELLAELIGPPAPPPVGAPPASPAVASDDEGARIAAALVATGGNVARCARRLGRARSTLRHQIDRYGLRGLIPCD